MAAPKRTKFEIEDNRRDITRLYLRGKTQAEIAKELEISRAMVAYDLGAIQNRWKRETVRDLDADKVQELEKLAELERTYWAAWDASLERMEATATERTEDHDGASTKATVKREPRYGNPAYLQGVMRCIERRAKLLGLDAPVRQEHSGPNGVPIQADLRVVLDDLLRDPDARNNLDALARRMEGHASGNGGEVV